MVHRAVKFTPEVMLSAPRRSAGIPNSSGDAFLHTTSTYSFETHSKSTVLRIVNIKTGDAHDVVKDKDVTSFAWLDKEYFAFLVAEEGGVTSVWVGVTPWEERKGWGSEEVVRKSLYVAGSIDAPAGDLKIAQSGHGHGEFIVVFSAQASPDGKLFNSVKAPKTQSTGRLYSSLYVRHWDRYETKEKNSLWFSTLSRGDGHKFKLGEISNMLKDTGLESPIPPFGGINEFDICHNCCIFCAKDPDLDPALNTKSDVYIIRFTHSGPSTKTLQKIIVPGYEGASTSPVVYQDGSKAAFLKMKENGYEADRNHIFVAPLGDSSTITAERALTNSRGDEPAWDRSPLSVCFTWTGRSLLAIAEDVGSSKLFLLPEYPVTESSVRPLTNVGSVSDVRCFWGTEAFFISGSTLVDNSFYAILDPTRKPKRAANLHELTTWSHSNSAQGTKFGLHYGQISSIWTPASNPKINKEVHSLVVKPSNFDSSKKYPVAYLIHGGPQSSWEDNWSTRWNPAVYAEQGYIVITPNPTGSTGYGQEFCDSIKENWGGDPYYDIVNCFDWVSENMPEADNERAVALGASYGGYMMNWIQGHDLGRKFKALVCHDGILSTAGMLSTEELYFPFRDIQGTPWYDPDARKKGKSSLQAQRNFGATTFPDWRRWDPSEHFTEWSTPELVIHNEKDFRICIADGLAAFNVLQARGVHSQFLSFPDENHWVLKPENSLAWHKVVLNWINKYVGLPPFTTQDPESAEFWGGERGEREEVTEIEGQGKIAI